jgi:hypothetical protein
VKRRAIRQPTTPSVVPAVGVNSVHTHDQLDSARSDGLASAFHRDLTSYHGPSIVFGIMLAGAAYPIVLGALGIVIGSIIIAWSLLAGMGLNSDWVQLVAFPMFAVAIGASLSIPALMWTAFVSGITLPVLYLVARSLRLKGSIARWGAAAGGCVGFACLLPVTLILPWNLDPSDVTLGVTIFLLGPGLATIVGQIGGAWGGRQAEHDVRKYRDSTIGRTGDDDPPIETAQDTAESNSAVTTAPEPRLQFGVRQMMWTMVWISLLLSVIRLSGLSFAYVLPVLMGWLLFQATTLNVGGRLLPRLERWYGRRRASSST